MRSNTGWKEPGVEVNEQALNNCQVAVIGTGFMLMHPAETQGSTRDRFPGHTHSLAHARSMTWLPLAVQVKVVAACSARGAGTNAHKPHTSPASPLPRGPAYPYASLVTHANAPQSIAAAVAATAAVSTAGR